MLISIHRTLRHAVGYATVVFIGSSGFANAQAPPDAGSLLQQIEQQRRPALPPKAPPRFEPPPPLESTGGTSVTVTSFRFAGNTLLTSDELAQVVAEFENRSLDFAALQNAALAVATAYRAAGWVVRVYLPQQDIAGGVVTIQIVEAVFGGMRVDGDATRIATGRLIDIVGSAQPAGTPLNADRLDRALLLISDLPGLVSSGRLVEGRDQAETDLALNIADGPPVAGNVSADDDGARATGTARVIANATVNAPLQVGDRADALYLHTEGSDYLRGAYSVPLGSAGWRVGVNASHLSYRVVTARFESLDARGTSTTAGLEASYPLVRSQAGNLYLSVSADDGKFDNRAGGATVTKYRVPVAGLALYGNAFDDFGGGGINVASIGIEQGRVDLDGSPNQLADSETTRTAGGFRKLRFTASREQRLTDVLSLYAGLTGQLASKNLDSSEKFYLGGATGVRAYPVGEGGGSQGAMLNLEARARLPWDFHAIGFFDWGTAQANKDNHFTGAAMPNRYDLKGGGVSIGWTARFGLDLRATVARRIGGNPDRTASGTDQDGSLKKNRIWLQASQPF